MLEPSLALRSWLRQPPARPSWPGVRTAALVHWTNGRCSPSQALRCSGRPRGRWTARRAAPGFARQSVGPALRALSPLRKIGGDGCVGRVKRSGPADWRVEMARRSSIDSAIPGQRSWLRQPPARPSLAGRSHDFLGSLDQGNHAHPFAARRASQPRAGMARRGARGIARVGGGTGTCLPPTSVRGEKRREKRGRGVLLWATFLGRARKVARCHALASKRSPRACRQRNCALPSRRHLELPFCDVSSGQGRLDGSPGFPRHRAGARWVRRCAP